MAVKQVVIIVSGHLLHSTILQIPQTVYAPLYITTIELVYNKAYFMRRTFNNYKANYFAKNVQKRVKTVYLQNDKTNKSTSVIIAYYLCYECTTA